MVAYPFGPSWAAVGEQVTAGYAAFFFSLYGTRLSVIALKDSTFFLVGHRRLLLGVVRHFQESLDDPPFQIGGR
jgi:hypothetical protein